MRIVRDVSARLNSRKLRVSFHNKILRALDVILKEGRELVLVPRKTPLNIIFLKNMVKLAMLGAIMLPAMPAFYNKLGSGHSIVNYVMRKILNVLNFDNALVKRWSS